MISRLPDWTRAGMTEADFRRFMSKVVVTNGCWRWRGTTSKDGRGSMHLLVPPENKYKMIRAHRLSFQLWNGRIGAGLVVCHRCDNPNCVNPDHLFLGTQADNLRDMVSKGRHLAGRIAASSKFCGELSAHAKLTPSQVREILTSSLPSRAAGRLYGVSASAIQRIRNGQTWSRSQAVCAAASHAKDHQ